MAGKKLTYFQISEQKYSLNRGSKYSNSNVLIDSGLEHHKTPNFSREYRRNAKAFYLPPYFNANFTVARQYYQWKILFIIMIQIINSHMIERIVRSAWYMPSKNRSKISCWSIIQTNFTFFLYFLFYSTSHELIHISDSWPWIIILL